ncbi:MAG: DUF4347 domain-containing protein [Plectolyngbya sp. WJT66-NPBG17]|nr:DUF4347 domain-containing protein [Plectolyngbya sp. WJT66-NPBG17]
MRPNLALFTFPGYIGAYVVEPNQVYSLQSALSIEQSLLTSSPLSTFVPSSRAFVSGLSPFAKAYSASSSAEAKSLVIVDGAFAADQQLLKAIHSDQEVVILDPTQNGVDQISSILAQHRNIDALHIISHGNAGLLQLGSIELSLETLDRNAAKLASWKEALAPGADVLLYACNAALGSQGNQFIQRLSQLIGADIAASDNITGNQKFNGDWNLEVNTGEIATKLAFDQDAIALYDSTLAAISPDVVQGLKTGLQQFATWSDRIETLSGFTAEIPVVGESIGKVIDISSLLKNQFADPLANYLDTDTTPTVEEFVDRIKSLSATVGDLTFTLNPASVTSALLGKDLSFNLKFEATRTVKTNFDLGETATTDFGVKLNGSTTVDLTGQLVFDFAFGYDTTLGLAPSEAFYVKINELSANAIAQANNLNMGLEVGFLGADVKNGSLSLNANLAAQFNDPNSDNKLTLDELQGTSITTLVGLTPTGALNVSLPVSAQLAGLSLTGTPTLTILDDNVFTGALPTVDVQDFAQLLKFKQLSPADVVNLLRQVGGALQNVSAGLNPEGGIPFLKDGIDTVVDFAKIVGDLTNGFFDQVINTSRDAVQTGILSANASFDLKFNNEVPITIVVARDTTNQNLDDLVADLNTAIATANLTQRVVAERAGNRLSLKALKSGEIVSVVATSANTAVTELGFSTTGTSVAVQKFSTIQELVDELVLLTGLNKASIDAKYDAGTNALTFRIAKSADFEKSVNFDFSQDIDLGAATLNLAGGATGQFKVNAGFNLGLGINLSPLGDGFVLTNAMTLDSLNAGAGVQNIDGKADIKITLRDGSSFEVDFDGATTVGDAIAKINTASNSKLIASINADKTALKLIDSTTGTTAFTIVPINDSLAGLGLGIVGSDIDADGTIIGGALHGDSFSKRTFLTQDSSIFANAKIGANDVNLSAALSMLEIGIKNGTASLDLIASLGLKDPTPNDLGITLNDILNNTSTLSALVDPTFQVMGGITLPIAIDGLSDFGLELGTQPQVALGFTLDPLASEKLKTTATVQGFQEIVDRFKNFSAKDVLRLVGKAIEFLQNEDAKALNTRLPLVNQSLNELLGFLDPIKEAYSGIQDKLKGIKSLLSDKLTTIRTASTNSTFSNSLTPEARDQLAQALNLLDGAIQKIPTSLDALADIVPAQVISQMGEVRRLLNSLPSAVDKTAIKAAFDGFVAELPSAQMMAKFLFEAFGYEFPTFGSAIVQIGTDLDSAIKGLSGGAKKSDFEDALAQINQGISQNNPFILAQAFTALKTAIQDLKGSDKDAFTTVLSNFSKALPQRFSLSFNADKELLFDFDLDIAQYQKKDIPLNFSLDNQGTPIPIDFRTEGKIDMVLGASLNLGFGLDILNATPFIQASTGLELYAKFDVSDFGVTVGLGGVEASLGNGQGKLSLKNGTDPATFKLGLNPKEAEAGKILFSKLGLNSFVFTTEGSIKVELPVALVGVDVGTVGATLTDLKDFSTFKLNAPTGLLGSLAAGKLDLNTLLTGIDLFLAVLQKGLEGDVLKKLPIVGKNLDLGGTGSFIKDLREKFLAPLRQLVQTGPTKVEEEIQKVIFNNLNPLGILKLTNRDSDSAINFKDVAVVVDINTGELTIDLHIGGESEFETDFNLGLEAFVFDFKTAGGVELSLGYDLQIGFGVNLTEGFYLRVPTNEPDFKFNLGVNLKNGTTISADLFVLNVAATNKLLDEAQDNKDYNRDGDKTDTFQTGINGEIAIDLVDPNKDGKLLLSELRDTKIAATLNTSAVISLKLEAGVGQVDSPMPKVSANLFVEWSFDKGFGAAAGTGESKSPIVALNDLGLDLGDFMTRAIQPLLQNVNEYLKPIRPVLDLLEKELPGISDLSKLVGRGPVTFIDAIKLFGSGGATIAKWLTIVRSIDSFIQESAETEGNIFINFGDFNFSQDLRKSGNIDLGSGNFNNGVSSVDGSLDRLSGGTGTGAVSKLKGLFGKLKQIGLDFPLLSDPASVLGLFTGKSVDLVTWKIPELKAELKFSQKFGPIIPPIPLFATIGGTLGVAANFSVGFDTSGLQKGNFIKGFYFGDRAEVFKGADIPEVSLYATFTAGASLSVVVAEAGIEGGIKANISANWNDQNNDGKVYIDELLSTPIACVFDLSGSLNAFLRAYGRIGFDTFLFGFVTLFETDITIVDVTLLDFNLSCEERAKPPILAEVENGVLKLNLGDRASRRGADQTDGDENFSLKQLEAGKIEVTYAGYTQVYSGVSSIEGDGGKGNDTILLDDSITLNATLRGGEGNDKLKGGSGNDNISGGIGNDQLQGGAGNDTLDGDDSNDQIVGGAGEDTIRGGTGNDSISGDTGANDAAIAFKDIIDGGDGNDNIRGDAGDDEITGGVGRDVIFGGRGNDTLRGGDENDLIEGGAGADQIFGDAGDDTLYGDSTTAPDAASDGNDTIRGGNGNDTIEDLSGNNRLYGDEGDDQLKAGDGNDYLEGGTGSDTLWAGKGGDQLIGGSSTAMAGTIDGNDELYGEAGNDILLGDNGTIALNGTVSLIGGAGADKLYGNDGDDVMFGQSGDDLLEGAAGNDALFGGQGADTLRAQEDDDYLEGGAGSDVINAGVGNDLIIGGSSTYLPESGADGNDSITAAEGNDIILGDDGRVLNSTGQSVLSIAQISTIETTGGAGTDTVFGGSGNDIIFGGGGADILIGDAEGVSGDDIIVGDEGSWSATQIRAIAGSGGADTISGSGGNDILLGGDGNDTIAGDAGEDILLGDNGQVTRTQAGVVTRIQTASANNGGNDTLSGGDNADVVLGGSGEDAITGGTDDAIDILFGDNGVVVRADGSPEANDVFSTDESIGGQDTITGGLGNDVIVGGAGADQLTGNEGEDIVLGDSGYITRNATNSIESIETRVSAQGGDDTIAGNEGDDVLIGGAANDTINGNLGRDVIIGDGGRVRYNNGVIVRIETAEPLAGGNDTLNGNEETDTILGGSGNDVITGGIDDAIDILFGDNGVVVRTDGSPEANDLFSTDESIGGQDTITGGLGNDSIVGGAGADQLTGNEGNDVIVGDSGYITRDTTNSIEIIETRVSAQGGDDTIAGNEGDDILIGGAANDTINGNTGLDILIGDGGRVTLANDIVLRIATAEPTAGGNDILKGGQGTAIILGGTGDDTIEVGTDETNDILLGDNGVVVRADASPQANDIFSTDATNGGKDTITGGLGNDIIIGGAGGNDQSGVGGDRLFGNEGNDIVIGDHAYITRNSADVVEKIETIFPDQGGDDTIEGNTDNDVLLGGFGNDTITGSTGDDVVLGDNGSLDYTIDVKLNTLDLIKTTSSELGGSDTISGNEGNDIVFGGAANDTLSGDLGDDILFGDNGLINFVLDGDASTIDLVTSLDPTVGGEDKITGNEGDDRIFGGASNDTIQGNVGQDIIFGDNGVLNYSLVQGQNILDLMTTDAPDVGGNDVIEGNEGDDRIFGGAGNDQIQGNAGQDIILGDNGILDYRTDQNAGTLEAITTSAPSVGGDDTITGNEGDDRILGGSGNDTIKGNVGQDIILGDNGTLLYELDQGNSVLSQIATIDPSAGGDDAIEGNEENDRILGGSGNDTIKGNAGKDIILGDNGSLSYLVDQNPNTLDLIDTDSPNIGGKDTIEGNDDNDIVIAGAANDTVTGDAGDDILIGDHALIQLQDGKIKQIASKNPGIGGDDLILGGEGNDLILGGFAQDKLYGNAGNDRILGDNGRFDFAFAGDAIVSADTDLSTLDVITTTDPTLGGNDRIFGGTGEDQVLGGTGSDFVAGDDGIDPTFMASRNWAIVNQADFNGDGYADIVWRDQVRGDVGVWLMNGTNIFDAAVVVPGVPLNWTIQNVGDFNNDGKADLLWRDQISGGVVVWLMNDTQILDAKFTVPSVPLNWTVQNVGDFNNDGKTDLLWRDRISGGVVVWLMNDTQILDAKFTVPSVPLNWTIQNVGDFNNDGKTDLLWRDQVGGGVVVWLMDGTQILNAAVTVPGVPLNWTIQNVGDFNNDGKTDILWRDQVGGSVVVWLMDGTALLDANVTVPGVPLNWTIQNVGDFNNDGKTDILWRDQVGGGAAIWLINGTALLDAAITVPGVPLNWTVQNVGDFNNDGKTDLLWRDQISGSAAIWLINDTALQSAALFSDRSLIPPDNTIPSDDLVMGDHGIVYQALRRDRNYLSIDTQANDGGGNDILYGDQGDDILLGQQGNDNLNGGTGEDDMIGGHNVIGGADGDDALDGGADADVMIGDNGTITRRLVNGAWQRYVAPFNSVIRDVVRFDDVDRIGGNDILWGGTGDDIIQGQRGDDQIEGGAGDDELYGQLGNDSISGGDGQDTILGDVGIISRDYNSDGTARVNLNGSWHRDVILTDVGSLSGSVSGVAQPGQFQNPDLLLLMGEYDAAGNKVLESGQWKLSTYQVSLFADGNDTIDGGNGEDAVFGQRGNDTIQGGLGNDYIEGNAGDDRIDDIGGNDFIVGDDTVNLMPFNAELPTVTRGIHLIEQSVNLNLELGLFGTIVTPTMTLVPKPFYGLLPTLTRSQPLPRDNSPTPIINVLRRANGNSLKAFVSVVPNAVDHLDLLVGNDRISAGAGFDTVVGDNYINTVPLRTGITSIDQGFDLMTRSLYHLMYDLHNLELAVTGRSGAQPQELTVGSDIIDAGDDRDLVMSDNGVVMSGFAVRSPGDAATLSQQILDLQQVLTAFNTTVNVVSAPLGGTTTQPYTFAIGNDQVGGGGGDDKLFADDTLILEPIFRNPNYVRGSFWNYSLIGANKPARSDLREFNLKLGNDTMSGGDGNDFMVAGYANLILPLVDRAPQNNVDRAQLQRDLELLGEDAKSFIRDLHTTTHGIIYPNANQSHTLIAGNDTMNGDRGDDIMVGDNITLMMPIINRQIDLNFELNKSFLDYGEEEHNFNQAFPHQYNFIYRTPNTGVTQLGEDTMFGSDGNDIMFGIRGIDQMSGNNGDDYIFGGAETDGLDGGTGTNIVRTTNPSAADLTVINPTIRTALFTLFTPAVQRTIVELDQSKNNLTISGDLIINFPD